jgi:FkbM family methyltransferase
MRKILRQVTEQLTPPILVSAVGKLRSYFKRYNSLNGLDRKIEKYLSFKNGFFVELGANDGISQSNTLYFEKHKNWKGVLIEPTPHKYLKCLNNRSNENHIFCNACVSFEYDKPFVEIAFSNLMSSPIGLESDIIDPVSHAESGKQFLETSDRVFIYGSLAKTLTDLLNRANAPAMIDLLSLDVEGAEIEVLKGIDHQKYRFRYMCIECRDISKLTHYLHQVGYRLVEKLSEQDYLFADQKNEFTK